MKKCSDIRTKVAPLQAGEGRSRSTEFDIIIGSEYEDVNTCKLVQHHTVVRRLHDRQYGLANSDISFIPESRSVLYVRNDFYRCRKKSRFLTILTTFISFSMEQLGSIHLYRCHICDFNARLSRSIKSRAKIAYMQQSMLQLQRIT